MTPAVPQPRSSPDAAPGSADAALARRYATELGWATAGRAPLRLLTGALFDVLELPAEAGHAVLRRGVRTGPVLLSGTRMGLLVAAGGADELPGLLDWLEWGPVALDLAAVGAGAVSRPRLSRAPRGTRRGPLCGCGPQSRGVCPGRDCRPSRASGAAVGMPPISYAWWTPRLPNAIGSGCHAPVPGC